MYRTELRAFVGRIDACASADEMAAVEAQFQDQLFRMVNRPLFRVADAGDAEALRHAARPTLFADSDGVRAWRQSRHRIIGAILDRDTELARFEATRARRDLLDRLRESRNGSLTVDSCGRRARTLCR
ncbi:MAG: hypothetical protein IPF57_18050 [Gammaproteobacteria bacterium]|nr:hypothetical protein [Gammaproteobacteria bacterium]